jgi:hypothetical protein
MALIHPYNFYVNEVTDSCMSVQAIKLGTPHTTNNISLLETSVLNVVVLIQHVFENGTSRTY